ncbi:MAG TPA: DEAD/DEAH box helicase [Acidimicrobiales bacterium]
MLAGEVRATFVGSQHGRDGRAVVALWHPDQRSVPGADSVEVAQPVGRSVRRIRVGGTCVAVGDVLLDLVALPRDAEVTPSVAAWAAAAQIAVDLVARGRIRPALTPARSAGWAVGPFDLEDRQRMAELAAALPVEAFAVIAAGRGPMRVPAPEAAVEEFMDAVADGLVRTAAAGLEGGGLFGQPAAGAPSAGAPSAEVADWLEGLGGGLEGGAIPGLRITLPLGPEAGFEAVVQLRSQLDPSLVVDAAELWSAPAVVLDRLGVDAESDLLLGLRRLSKAWAPAAALLDQPRPEVLQLTDDDAMDLLGSAAAAVASTGVEVLWPSELGAREVQLRAVVGTPAPTSVTEAGLTVESLVEVRLEATVDGRPLTAAELNALAEAKRPMVRLRGRFVLADPALIERLRHNQVRRVRAGEALAAALAGAIADGHGGVVEARCEGPLAQLAARLSAARDGADLRHELLEPPGLEVSLRPYQRRGLGWIASLTALGLGGCLADDMGLGKTVQALALHLHRHDTLGPAAGPTLVVCPATLLSNWQREAARFAPAVDVRRYHGGERHLDAVQPNEIVLATYGMVRRDHAALAEVGWGLVIADEAQHVKNPLSRTARDLRRIPSASRLALTGTPVENRLSELWSILDWAVPGLLGPLDTFRRQVAIPVERYRDPEATAAFARVVRPFVLRRHKLDPGIAPELPPKVETDNVVPLSAEQATLYGAVVKEALAQIAEAEGISRRGLVLKLLTALKQVCNHPAHYLGQRGPLAGRSGKLDAFDELVTAVLDGGEQILVFTQYVAMGRLLERRLGERGVASLFLHGGVALPARQELVDRFQSGAAPVLLLSLKAGGTGLNLTAATQVIHYDRWWNPAVEDQASDRAWRIGQHRAVQVHRLITEGTVEDRVAALLTAKRQLADAVVGGGEAWVSELSNAELADLVTLQVATP